MGFKSVILMFLLALSMNGIVSLWGQLMPATQNLPIEMAQNDKPIDTEEKEPVPPPEQKRPVPEPARPKTSTSLKEGPPKDFVPSEKIPADQAVDFPTDI
jgi:hypothetical protein